MSNEQLTNTDKIIYEIAFSGLGKYHYSFEKTGFGVLLEDDGDKGCWILTNENGDTVFETLFLYHTSSPLALKPGHQVFVIWNGELQKIGLYYRGKIQAVFDLGQKRACCRLGQVEQVGKWSNASHVWDESLAWNLRNAICEYRPRFASVTLQQNFEYFSLESAQELRENPLFHVVVLPKNLENRLDLLKQYRDQTGMGYLGTSWESLDELLIDCEWMETDDVYILHDSLPSLLASDLKVYIEVLSHAMREQAVGPKSIQSLPQRKIRFHVGFIVRSETERRAIEQHIIWLLWRRIIPVRPTGFFANHSQRFYLASARQEILQSLFDFANVDMQKFEWIIRPHVTTLTPEFFFKQWYKRIFCFTSDGVCERRSEVTQSEWKIIEPFHCAFEQFVTYYYAHFDHIPMNLTRVPQWMRLTELAKDTANKLCEHGWKIHKKRSFSFRVFKPTDSFFVIYLKVFFFMFSFVFLFTACIMILDYFGVHLT